jgi:nucleolar protein 53
MEKILQILRRSLIKMPKQAKKKWRKNINLDDLYEGIQQTRQELASGYVPLSFQQLIVLSGIVREKADAELFSIDDTGAVPENAVTLDSESPKKRRRKPLKVDEILGTTETKVSVPSRTPRTTTRQLVVKEPKAEEKKSYDVWTPVEQPSLSDDLPPPAILPYSKKVPALPPTTIRSTKHLIRNPESKEAVAVANGGQSYNPAFEEWKNLIDTSAEKEQERLARIAQREWVPEPQDVEMSDAEDEEEEEEEASESFLAKPVSVVRKTKSQRNKQVRHLEQVC